ncbi:MAG: hypothetical protein IKK29_02810, partial [Christensenellaceae bacterium]|nr:hypothetical protein [Christensenellaceae bacterium]
VVFNRKAFAVQPLYRFSAEALGDYQMLALKLLGRGNAPAPNCNIRIANIGGGCFANAKEFACKSS